jgi:phosphatidylglycerophosphatase A
MTPNHPSKQKSLLDYVALGLSTVGVGYIPVAPGTCGSVVGILIFITVRAFEDKIVAHFLYKGTPLDLITAWIHAGNLVALLLLCAVGFWAATRTAILFKIKDPQKVVIDEVMGQLITFLFVPFSISWKYIIGAFLLFRLFDIWKPYPIDQLQSLTGGVRHLPGRYCGGRLRWDFVDVFVCTKLALVGI